MGNSNSTPKISDQDRAILDLKNQRDNVRRYQKQIEKLTERETDIAKQCLARNDRKRALLALRRKKYQESLLAKTDGQLEQLQQLSMQVEFSLVQKDVLFGLQQGTRVLQDINKEIGGMEGVDKLMDETDEARAYQEEISQMIAGQLSKDDEDEVENELAGLQSEVQSPAPVKSNFELPEVPNGPIHQGELGKKQPAEGPERAEAKERTALPA